MNVLAINTTHLLSQQHSYRNKTDTATAADQNHKLRKSKELNYKLVGISI